MKAIVFDWDGTLVDTLPAITVANAEVLSSLGVSYDDAAYRAAYSPDWRAMYRRLGVPEDLVEDAGTRWLGAYRALMTQVRAFDGVNQAVERLAGAGFQLGIVTAGDRPVVEHQLQATGSMPSSASSSVETTCRSPSRTRSRCSPPSASSGSGPSRSG